MIRSEESLRQKAGDQQAAVVDLAGSGEGTLSVPDTIQQRESVGCMEIGLERPQDAVYSEKLGINTACFGDAVTVADQDVARLQFDRVRGVFGLLDDSQQQIVRCHRNDFVTAQE